jgi:hypothetical protein
MTQPINWINTSITAAIASKYIPNPNSSDPLDRNHTPSRTPPTTNHPAATIDNMKPATDADIDARRIAVK